MKTDAPEIGKLIPSDKLCLVEFTAMNSYSIETFINKDDGAIKISLKARFPSCVIHKITEYEAFKRDERVVDPTFEVVIKESKNYIKHNNL